MSKSTRQIVFDGMETLPNALIPFVELRLRCRFGERWQARVAEKLPDLRTGATGHLAWDQAALLNAIDRFWTDAFKSERMGRAERALVNELVAVRNNLSHNRSFTIADAERALDSMCRLMEAIGSSQTAVRLRNIRDTDLRDNRKKHGHDGKHRRSPLEQFASKYMQWILLILVLGGIALGFFRITTENATDLHFELTDNTPTITTLNRDTCNKFEHIREPIRFSVPTVDKEDNLIYPLHSPSEEQRMYCEIRNQMIYQLKHMNDAVLQISQNHEIWVEGRIPRVGKFMNDKWEVTQDQCLRSLQGESWKDGFDICLALLLSQNDIARRLIHRVKNGYSIKINTMILDYMDVKWTVIEDPLAN